MRCTVLMLSLLILVCIQVETAAQNDTITIISTATVDTMDESINVMVINTVTPTNINATTSTVTTKVMTSSVMPMTTAIIVITSNLIPTPSDNKTDSSGFSSGVIVGFVAGGGIPFLVILVIFISLYCYRKHHKEKLHVIHQATIQIMPDGYVPRSRNSSVRASQIAHSLQASLMLFKNTFKHKDNREQPHFISPL